MRGKTVMEAMKAVLAGFMGIRRRADHEKAALKPVHVIVAAVVLLALFVASLIAIVRLVTR